MSLLTVRELHELDVDWYCSINGHPVHIASMGGPIPSPFNERRILRGIEDAVVKLPNKAKASLNEKLIKQEIAEGYEYIDELQLSDSVEKIFGEIPSFSYNMNWNLKTRLFACSFVDKARKGFYSYGRIGKSSEYKYGLIAKPSVEIEPENNMFSLSELNLGNNYDGLPNILFLE